MPPSADLLAVLIVEDDPALLRTMGDVLRLKGYEPYSAQTGGQALEVASRTPPAVTLLDLRLPDMDGHDLIERLHAADVQTEIVVLTGNASVTSAVRALREHIFDYLLKPVSPDQLVTTLERAGERWRRRRAEAALAATEQRFRSLIEHAEDPVAILDHHGLIRYASPAYQRTLGSPSASLVGTNVFETVHPEDASVLRDAISDLLTRSGETTPIVLRCRRADGQWRTLAGTGKNLLGDPTIDGIILNSRDVTDRLALEEQLRHAQKIEAVGQLAGGIAHDLNNMLTAILAFSEFAEGSLPADHEGREDIEQVQLAAQRAALLTRQLLAFSRRQVLHPRPIDLTDVVGGLEPMLRRLISAEIDCVARLAPSLDLVMADPSQIEQVLLNLVINARDAMPRGGSIVIETRQVAIDTDDAQRHPGLTPGPHVVLSVTDNGTGMDAITQARVFEPFFTTKPVGQGTGLGLSTVYGIVRQSGGSISLRSEPGQGATFDIYLPCTDSESEVAAPEGTTANGALPPMTILVADDDAAVRRAATRALERAGHTVLTADNGREGLALLAARADHIGLVVSDLVMPNVGGRDFAAGLRERWPNMRLLFMSGYNTHENAGQLPPGGDAFLQKPFTPDGLLEAVRRAVQHSDRDSRPPRRSREQIASAV